MKKTAPKLLLTLLLVAMVGSLCFANLQAATTKEFGKATELKTGSYIIVVPNITPTGGSAGAYYIDPASFEYGGTQTGLGYKAFNAANQASCPRWKISKISANTCQIQNEALGNNGYLNLNSSNLFYGTSNEPTATFSFSADGGLFKFYRNINGKNIYIRFTNGASSGGPHFQAGSGEASHQYELYTELEVEQLATSKDADAPLPKGNPEFVIACLSDLHCDYNMQRTAPYIRASVTKTAKYLRTNEDVDVLLIGGDITSDNQQVRSSGGWTPEIFDRVVKTYDETLTPVTDKGWTLYACGNHDYQAGETEGYNSYAAFADLTLKYAKNQTVSVFRQKDDATISAGKYPDNVLGMHFKLGDFDFFIVNSPYSQALVYSDGLLNWLDRELKAVGAEKTCFITGHYPMTDSRNISTPSYGMSGANYSKFINLLKKYPNAVYLYGHNHGGNGSNLTSIYIHDDTFERITTYSPSGKPINDRYVIPTSFITSFMGSMSYYNYPWHSGGLGNEEPSVIQTLLIYVYKDRLVFSMKNCGTSYSSGTETISKTLKTWTVMRDVEGTNLKGETKPTDQPTQTETDTATEDILTASLLVSTDLNESIVYRSDEGINAFKPSANAVTLKSYGTSVQSDTLDKKDTLTVKTPSDKDLTEKMGEIAYTYKMINLVVKDSSGKEKSPENVLVTMKIPSDFGEKAKEITYGVYYLNNGVLTMTDAVVNKDGTVSFVVPTATPVALTGRATVRDQAEPKDLPTTETTDTDLPDDIETNGNTLTVVLLCIGAVLLLAAIAVILIFVLKKNGDKKEQ